MNVEILFTKRELGNSTIMSTWTNYTQVNVKIWENSRDCLNFVIKPLAITIFKSHTLPILNIELLLV